MNNEMGTVLWLKKQVERPGVPTQDKSGEDLIPRSPLHLNEAVNRLDT
ncbi:MAG: hypothetical protein AB1473_19515 [Thermodesulfobacteriota bacterium]